MNIKINNNIYQVGGRGLTDPSDAAVYLLKLGGKAALIDAGTGRDHAKMVKNIAECLEPGVQIEYLFLTHCHFDHAGGARALRDEFGCRIVVHELDAIYLETGDNIVTGAAFYRSTQEPFTPDIKLKDRESIIAVGNGSVTAIHTPGHSPGSVVYTISLDDRLILFGQDLQAPLRSERLSDENKYLDSLAEILKLDADMILEGHFGIIETKSEVRLFVQNCISPAPEPCRC